MLTGSVWSCGEGYASLPDCQATYGTVVPDAGCASAPDAGVCFTCAFSEDAAGTTCGCVATGDGGATWDCLPSGATCSQ